MKLIKAGIPPKKEEFICGNCFKTFSTYSEFEDHWRNEHQAPLKPVEEEGKESTGQ